MVANSSAVYLFAFAIRIAVFIAVLGLLPRRLVPFSVRVSLGVAFIIFFAALVPGAVLISDSGSPDLGYYLDELLREAENAVKFNGSSQESASFPGYRVAILEAGIGMSLALGASIGAYAAKLISSWLSVMVFGPFVDISRENSVILRPSVARSISTIFLLVFVYTLFSLPGFSAVWPFLAQSLVVFPYYGIFSGQISLASVTESSRIVAETGSVALLVAVTIALPLFTASLLVDFLYLLYKRYFPQAFSLYLADATRAPAVILVLALGLYAFSGDLAELLEQSFDESRAEDLLQQAREGGR